MTTNELILLGIAAIGWIWGVIQFFIKRRYQKSDKLQEKRFDVYTNFMNQMDEMSNNMRNDPNMIYGISNEFISAISNGNQEEIDEALLSYNSKLIEITKNSLQPMMAVNQELNRLKLVASDELEIKIDEYKKIGINYTNDYQIALNGLDLSTNLENTTEILQSIAHPDRMERMSILWKEIEELMRKEIMNRK